MILTFCMVSLVAGWRVIPLTPKTRPFAGSGPGWLIRLFQLHAVFFEVATCLHQQRANLHLSSTRIFAAIRKLIAPDALGFIYYKVEGCCGHLSLVAAVGCLIASDTIHILSPRAVVYR